MCEPAERTGAGVVVLTARSGWQRQRSGAGSDTVENGWDGIVVLPSAPPEL